MSSPLPYNAQGLLVLPHLRVQNANAISSQMTHGFPSITAFTGLMWALERKLTAADVPLRLQKVGVICHQHHEQVNDGYVKAFRLTRNPVGKDGSTAAIVEEGRVHLDITLVFEVELKSSLLIETERAQLAVRIGELVASMRVAGGSVMPPLAGARRYPPPAASCRRQSCNLSAT